MDIKNVLVADAVDAACVDLLKKHSIQVTCKYKLPKDQLIAEIPSYDALIVRSDTKVTAEVIEAGKKLKVIGRAGAGVDNIDINAATAKNILVLNTPGGNAISACELTCSLITTLARNVVPAAASLKAGRWDRKLYSGHELYGKTLGILGLGRIGKEVALRMQAWGMRTIGYDPIVPAAEAKKFNVEALELEQIWPQVDYITVHTPLIPETRRFNKYSVCPRVPIKYNTTEIPVDVSCAPLFNTVIAAHRMFTSTDLISEGVLNKCKKGVKIVNVARGGIIHESDLLKALRSGQCGGAGLDVFEQEPPKDVITLELIQHEKVVATPHLGASTEEAQVRVAVEISEQIIALTGKSKEYTSTPGVVNRSVLVNLSK